MASAATRQEVWTIGRILDWTQKFFNERGIQSARLDAELLLSHSLGVDRVYLYTHYDQPLSDAEREPFRQRVQRRARREPVAYLLGTREFYGRDFEVTPSVLIPRPETEHVVEHALSWLREHAPEAPHLLDIGTGSGVLALTLACELPSARVVATDLSAAALEVAKGNARRLGVADRVEFYCGDGVEPAREAVRRRGAFQGVVSNPPYVNPLEKSSLQPEVRDYEPAEALFAEEGGMALIDRLCADVPSMLAQPGAFICEIGYDQRERSLASAQRGGAFASTRVEMDLAGRPRVLIAERDAGA